MFADGDSAEAQRGVTAYAHQLRDAPLRPLALTARRLYGPFVCGRPLADSDEVTRTIQAIDSLVSPQDTTGESKLTSIRSDVLRLLDAKPGPDRTVVDRVDARRKVEAIQRARR